MLIQRLGTAAPPSCYGARDTNSQAHQTRCQVSALGPPSQWCKGRAQLQGRSPQGPRGTLAPSEEDRPPGASGGCPASNLSETEDD